jgi:hypothetical protein
MTKKCEGEGESLQTIINLHPARPFFQNPDPEIAKAAMPKLGRLTLSIAMEFPICAIVTSFDTIYPELRSHWDEQVEHIRKHWKTLQKDDARPGMNDFHITSWMVTGKEEHIEALWMALERTDKRGLTADWAVSSLRKQSRVFDDAWMALSKKMVD